MRDPAGVLTYFRYDDKGVLFAMDKGGATYYVGADQVGTPKVVTDATGAIVKLLEFDSYGTWTLDSNADFVLPVGFAGGIIDTDTQLVRFGYRDYEPNTGRWTAKDPIFFEGGINLYQYVSNNPVNLKDPSGLCPWCAAAEYAAIEAEALFIRLSQTPAAQRAAIFAAQFGSRIANRLQNLYTKYNLDSGKCEKLANETAKLFEKIKGLNPRIIQITAPRSSNFLVIGEGHGAVGFDNRKHFIVRVGNMVYDAYTGVAGKTVTEYKHMLDMANRSWSGPGL